MWRRISRCEYCYKLSGDRDSEDFKFSITDFLAVWSASFSRAGFVAEITNSNNHLEDISGDELLSKVLGMLDEPESADVECSFDSESEHPVVKLLSRQHGYPLRFRVSVRIGSAVDFYKQVTHQLLQTVQDLRASERQLCAALTSKDREIQEFKAEGGQLLLKYLKTPVFNEEKHRRGHRTYLHVFGDEDHILHHIMDIAARKTISKVEKVEMPTVKVEGEVNEEPLSNHSVPGTTAQSSGASFHPVSASVQTPGASADSPGASVQSPGARVQSPGASVTSPGAQLKREASALPPPLPKRTKKKFLNM